MQLALNLTETNAAYFAETVISTEYLDDGEKATAIRNLLLAAPSEYAKATIRSIGRGYL